MKAGEKKKKGRSGEKRGERERQREKQKDRETERDQQTHTCTHARTAHTNQQRASRREGVRWGRERRKEAGKPREKWEEDKGGREGEECWEGRRKAGGVKRLSQSGRGDSCEAEAWQAAPRRRRRRL